MNMRARYVSKVPGWLKWHVFTGDRHTYLGFAISRQSSIDGTPVYQGFTANGETVFYGSALPRVVEQFQEEHAAVMYSMDAAPDAEKVRT